MQNINKILIVLILILLVFISGCIKTENNAQDKLKDKFNNNIITEIENLSWPKELMGNTPEFNGNLSSIKNDDKTCSMIFINTNRQETDKYIKELVDIGFKDGLELNDGEVYMYSGSREREKDIITLNYIDKDNTLLISYTKE